MTQRTYYEEPGPIWEWWGQPEITLPEDRNRLVIKHGYTLADLDRITRVTLSRCYGSYISRSDLYMLAYEAITVALMEATSPPDDGDLISAGHRCIASTSSQEIHHRGLNPSDWSVSTPRYTTYWLHIIRNVNSPEERLVEKISLAQVWPLLTPRQREALAALAATGTRAAAATALGIGEGSLNTLIRAARKKAFDLWFEHETPPRVPWDKRVRSYAQPLKTHCVHGHEYTVENTIWRYSKARRRQGRFCRACEKYRNEAKRTKQKMETLA